MTIIDVYSEPIIEMDDSCLTSKRNEHGMLQLFENEHTLSTNHYHCYSQVPRAHDI